jgi:hypothetical protein
MGYEGGYWGEDEAGMGVGSVSGWSCSSSFRVSGFAPQVGREESDGVWSVGSGILGFAIVTNGGVARGGIIGELGRVIWGRGVWFVGYG